MSRQLWWGHRIPAWYCPDGHVTVSSEADGPDGLRGLRPAGGGAARRTRTSSTPGSAPGCGRSRRSAGRTTRRTSRRYYPTSVMETGYDIIFFWVARMMMLGLAADRRGAVPHGLPVRPHPRPGRPEDVEDEGQRRRPARRHRRVRRRRPPLRADPRRHARQRPAVRRRPSSRTPATSPTSSGTRRGSSSAPGRRRSRRTPSGGCPDPGHLRPGRALAAVAGRRDDGGRRRGDGRLRVRRGDAAPVRRDLERVLRLGPRARQGPAGRRRRCRTPSARRPGGRWSRSSTPTCACSTRSCRS